MGGGLFEVEGWRWMDGWKGCEKWRAWMGWDGMEDWVLDWMS